MDGKKVTRQIDACCDWLLGLTAQVERNAIVFVELRL
jgi:hypothetical protein